jgi:hypothetical protein
MDTVKDFLTTTTFSLEDSGERMKLLQFIGAVGRLEIYRQGHPTISCPLPVIEGRDTGKEDMRWRTVFDERLTLPG